MAILTSLSDSLLTHGISLIAVVYVLFCIRSYWRLRHIPGPKLWAWSLLPLFRIHLKGTIYDDFGDLAKQYGPLVRIAPNTLLVSDPDVIRRMNATRSPYTRSYWYIAMRFNPGLENILSVRNDVRHEELRRKMGLGYSGKENLNLERDIDDCVRDLVNLVGRKYVSPSANQIMPMDLARKLQYFTSDVVSKLAFDGKFNDLQDDKDNFDYIHEVETIFPNIFCTCVIPGVVDFLTRIGFLGLFAPSANSNFGLGRVLALAKNQIAKRFDEEGRPTKIGDDMLGSFIRHGLTQAEAEQEAVMQLAAGSDTSATALRATMRNLISHPQVHKKLVAEIDAAIANGDIPSGEDEIVPDEVARKLPYLQACIKEGLRWWPPIAGMLAKQTPPEGDTVNGYFVPGGISMAYNANAVHHNPALFNPDPDAYRPERWLHTSHGGDEPSLEKIKLMERNNELVFGYGKYQCLGKSVAVIELNKVFVELLRRYEMSLMTPLKPWETICYGIHLQRNMWVSVKRRNPSGGESMNEKTGVLSA